jgi:hypothetical protein
MTTMATAAGNTQLKQIKALPTERINGKIKIQNKQDMSSPNVTNANVAPNGTIPNVNAKAVSGQQGEGLSPEQRRRVSGRPQMTTEEQKQALRKRVCDPRYSSSTNYHRWNNLYQQSMVFYLFSNTIADNFSKE